MDFKKIVAGTLLVFGLAVTGITASFAFQSNDGHENKGPVAYVTEMAGKAVGLEQAKAYTFNTSSGLVIESQDVSDVGTQVGTGITSYLQILKFVGLVILVSVTGVIVNKIFGIGKIS